MSDKKLLPYNLEAEQVVCGALLLHKDALALVADMVTEHDFYHPAHAAVYAAAIALAARNAPIDRLTVEQEMEASGTIEKLRGVKGTKYFAELTASVFTIENLPWHAEIVRTLATNRRIIEAAQEVAARGYGDEGRGAAYAGEASRLMFDASQGATRSTAQSVKSILRDVLKTIESRYEQKKAVTGVATGYHALDAMTAGFQPGDLVIIAARPSQGKTSLVMNIAQNVAIEYRAPILVFSLEMSRGSLVERMLCSEAGVDSANMRCGMLMQRDWINLTKASERLAGASIEIDEASSPSIVEIGAKARRWRVNNPQSNAAVIVDYLQLARGHLVNGRRDPNREREVSDIAKGLKALAKDLRCPVIALSQLNRACEERSDKRPMLSDIRESGDIEAAADVVMFIYRDEVYNKDTQDRGVAEIIIGKQRSGPVGTVRLAFLNQYTRFENLAARQGEDELSTRRLAKSAPPDRGGDA